MDQEREDYGDGPRASHRPTLNERARGDTEPRAASSDPTRTRLSAAAVAVIALGGVACAAILVLGTRLAADHLPGTWAKLVLGLGLVVVIQVTIAIVRRLIRRTEQQMNGPPTP
jgi:hypothetical protein